VTVSFRDLSRQLAPGEAGIELRISADFRITHAGDDLFADDNFDVVQFALAWQEWSAQPFGTFAFDSLEIHHQGAEGTIAKTNLPWTDITDPIDDFCHQLREAVQSEYGFDLDAIFPMEKRTRRRDVQ
jgi:hypothetical protein